MNTHVSTQKGNLNISILTGAIKAGFIPKKRSRAGEFFRDFLQICNKLWPYATVKLHKIEQVIDHYEPSIQDLDDTVIDLALERQLRNVE